MEVMKDQRYEIINTDLRNSPVSSLKLMNILLDR